jgi:hypothetical protein
VRRLAVRPRPLTALAALLAGAALLLPLPAYADAFSGYNTVITGIAVPADTTGMTTDQIEQQIPQWPLATLPGVTATSPQNGESITVENTTATPLIVHGYSGSYDYDAYLTISSAGVFTNSKADTTCLNQSVTLAVGCQGDDHAAPVWTKTKSADIFEWHDHRIHWMGSGQPPSVQANPHTAQVIDHWEIPFTYGGKHYAFVGTLNWKPASRWGSYLIWIVIALAVVALVVVQFVIRPRRKGPSAPAGGPDSPTGPTPPTPTAPSPGA